MPCDTDDRLDSGREACGVDVVVSFSPSSSCFSRSTVAGTPVPASSLASAAPLFCSRSRFCSASASTSPGSFGLSNPRSLINTHPTRHTAINGVCRINTARDAFIYASNIPSQSAATGTLPLGGTAYVRCASCLYPAGKLLCSVACRTAAETASPTAPPMQRKKFLLEITTARWDLVQCAWSATRLGWKVKPTPVPMRMRIMAMTPRLVVREKRIVRPEPLFVHRTKLDM